MNDTQYAVEIAEKEDACSIDIWLGMGLKEMYQDIQDEEDAQTNLINFDAPERPPDDDWRIE